MSPFSAVLEKKKHLRKSKGKKPFVVIWHTPATSYIQEVIDALTALEIPYVLRSAADHQDYVEEDLKRADVVMFFESAPRFYELAFQHLCVPVAPRTGKSTKDYNAVLEQGNGFYFNPKNKWEAFAAIIRACETFQFPYDWENLLREIYGMNRTIEGKSFSRN